MYKTLANPGEKTRPFKISIPDRILIISSLFVGLFGYTAISKALDIHSFRIAMLKSDLIKPYVKILSYAIPATEIIIALLLLIPVLKIRKLTIQTRKIGLYASLILMAGFTFYVAYILKYYEHLPCTCGGFINNMTWKQHLVFNISLLLLAAWAIYLTYKQSKLNNELQ